MTPMNGCRLQMIEGGRLRMNAARCRTHGVRHRMNGVARLHMNAAARRHMNAARFRTHEGRLRMNGVARRRMMNAAARLHALDPCR